MVTSRQPADPRPATPHPVDQRRANTQPTDPPPTFGLRALVCGVPTAVWLLLGLHLALLVGWSVLVPGYRAPDEPFHVDMVRAVADSEGWPGLEDRRISQQVLRSLVALRYSEPQTPMVRTHKGLQPAQAIERDERRTFAELGPDEPSGAANHMTQHPPLYYVATAAPVTVATGLLPAGDWSHDQVLALMRLTSVLMVAPLPLLAFATTRRLVGRAGPAATSAAVLPLAIPTLTHIGASVNNDNLMALLGGLLAVATAYVATGDVSRRTAVWVGLITGLALLTKGFALAVPLWVAAAYLVGAARTRLTPAVLAGVLAGGVALAAGGWWWLRNLVAYGHIQPTIVTQSPASPDFTPDVGSFWAFFSQEMVLRFWGSFGWDEVHLPEGAIWTSAALVLVGIVSAFGLPRRHPRLAPSRRGWADLAVLLLPVAAVTGIVAYGAWDWYTDTGQVSGIHGRYLFLAVVGPAAVAGLGWAALAGRWARLVPLLVLLGAAALQLTAADAVLRYFWGPVHFDRAGSALAMWAWSPWPTWVLGTLALSLAGLGTATAAFLVRDAWCDRPPAPEPSDTPPQPAERETPP